MDGGRDGMLVIATEQASDLLIYLNNNLAKQQAAKGEETCNFHRGG